jgi:YD repeat-containing protein
MKNCGRIPVNSNPANRCARIRSVDWNVKNSYDTANRLVSALIGTRSSQYVYGYDRASNLLSITPNGPTQSFSYTSTNAITSGAYEGGEGHCVDLGHCG